MAIVNLTIIKNWFKTGLKPTQEQFWDTWDSFRHKNDTVPANDVEGLGNLLLLKADKEAVANHLTDAEAHNNLFEVKVDKVEGKALSEQNYTLEEKEKLASLPITNFIHTQTIPSDTWSINHQLNKYPAITIIDTNGFEIEAEIIHTNKDNLTITFSVVFIGTAVLN